jgi:hypothetical protein
LLPYQLRHHFPGEVASNARQMAKPEPRSGFGLLDLREWLPLNVELLGMQRRIALDQDVLAGELFEVG